MCMCISLSLFQSALLLPVAGLLCEERDCFTQLCAHLRFAIASPPSCRPSLSADSRLASIEGGVSAATHQLTQRTTNRRLRNLPGRYGCCRELQLLLLLLLLFLLLLLLRVGTCRCVFEDRSREREAWQFLLYLLFVSLAVLLSFLLLLRIWRRRNAATPSTAYASRSTWSPHLLQQKESNSSKKHQQQQHSAAPPASSPSLSICPALPEERRETSAAAASQHQRRRPPATQPMVRKARKNERHKQMGRDPARMQAMNLSLITSFR